MRSTVILDLYHRNTLEASYYRRFLEDFSSIASPFTTLNLKKENFIWSKTCEKSSNDLKDKLTSVPLLTLLEGTNGFVVYCDSSS